MPGYQCGATTPAASNAAAYATIHSNARRVDIREWSFFTTAATASPISTGIAGNNATPPVASTSVTPQATDINTTSPDAAAAFRVDTAWTTAPTVPSVFHTKVTLNGTIGQGWILKRLPDRREMITLGQTTAQWFTFWNHGSGAGSALDMYVLAEE